MSFGLNDVIRCSCQGTMLTDDDSIMVFGVFMRYEYDPLIHPNKLTSTLHCFVAFYNLSWITTEMVHSKTFSSVTTFREFV